MIQKRIHKVYYLQIEYLLPNVEVHMGDCARCPFALKPVYNTFGSIPISNYDRMRYSLHDNYIEGVVDDFKILQEKLSVGNTNLYGNKFRTSCVGVK